MAHLWHTDPRRSSQRSVASSRTRPRSKPKVRAPDEATTAGRTPAPTPADDLSLPLGADCESSPRATTPGGSTHPSVEVQARPTPCMALLEPRRVQPTTRLPRLP